MTRARVTCAQDFGRQWQAGVVAVLLLFAIWPSWTVMADEPESREIRIAPTQRDDWLKRGWEPVRAADFARLRRNADVKATGPRSAWIERAEYSATLAEDTLKAGQLTARVIRKGNKPELLQLDPLNLVMSDLRWSDGQRAVFGTAADHRMLLYVDADSAEFQSKWSLRGRKVVDGFRFDVRVAPAMVSLLHLRLPEGQLLESSVGVVKGPSTGDAAGWMLWTVELGSRSMCRLRVRSAEVTSQRRSLVLATMDTSCVVRQAEIELQVQCNLHVLEAPVDRFVFELPADIKLVNVSYGGDHDIPPTTKVSGDMQRFVVHLADPVQGHVRPIRFRAIGAARETSLWTVPEIRVEGAAFLSGELRMRVETPLELQALELLKGYRHTGTVADVNDGETFSFQRYLSEARLDVRTGRPGMEAAARVVNLLDVHSDDWQLTSDVEYQVRSGSAYAVSCSLPQNWTISEVRAVGENTASRISNSSVSVAEDGRRILKVVFLDSLKPGHARSFRVVARRLSASGDQPASLPVLHPLDCGPAESVLVVRHAPGSIPHLTLGDAHDLTPTDELPEFASQGLLLSKSDGEASGQSSYMFSTRSIPVGDFSIVDPDPSYDAEVDVLLRVDGDQLNETFDVRITTGPRPLSRFYVYLTTAGRSLNWVSVSHPGTQIISARIAAAQHVDWGLPTIGELWEVQLPQPFDGDFHIKAFRTGPLESPTLLRLPGCAEFRGVVELQAPAGAKLEIDTDRLQPLDLDTTSRKQRTTGSQQNRSIRRWSYHDVVSTLELRRNDDATQLGADEFAALHVRTIVGADAGAVDIHSARFNVWESSGIRPFRFRLPDQAALIAVALNGQKITPMTTRDEYLVPQLPDTRANVIDIRYRAPSQAGHLFSHREIPLVRSTTHEVLEFDWQFALPSGVRLCSAPEFMLLSRPVERLSWTERLFGPIGRGANTTFFNPFSRMSWEAFATLDQAVADEMKFDSEDQWHPPAGWKVLHATAPSLPEKLTIQTWSRLHAQQIAWITVFGSALLVLITRVVEFQVSARVFALSLSLCIIISWQAPAACGLIAGGAVSGVILALLVPIQLLNKTSPRAADGDGVPQGSTVTHDRVSALITIILALVGFVSMGTVDRSHAQNTADPTSQDIDDLRTVVVVDGASPSTPADDILYVSGKWLEKLRRSEVQNKHASDYIISSADYRGRLDRKGFVSIDAHFQVAVLSDAENVIAHLPITNANFGYEQDCLVNGQPQPVLLATDGKGYLIALTAGDYHSPVNARKPRFARVDPHGTSAHVESAKGRSPIRWFDIVLKLRPPTTGFDSGARVEIGIPPVADCHLTMAFTEPYKSIDVPQAVGSVRVSPDGRSVSAEVGLTSRLAIIWSTVEGPFLHPTLAEAEVTGFIEARPTSLEFEYRIVGNVLSGSLSTLSLQLPRNAVLGELTSGTIRPSHSLKPISAEHSQLVAEFAEPLTNTFAIGLTFMLPISIAENEFQVPPIGLFDEEDSVEITLNQVGVTSPAEYDLDVAKMDSDELIPISTTTFISSSRSSRMIFDTPRFAYRLSRPVPLRFALTPAVARRIVDEEQVGRVDATQLHWTYNALVETHGSSVLQHTLLVSPQLAITSVSVLEDKAERLVRPSRVGGFLHLFLSDKTTGTQNIELKGTIPVEVGETFELPIIRIEKAEISDSNLSIYRAAGIDVTLENHRGLGSSPAATNEPPDKSFELVGQYKLPDGSPVPEITVVSQTQLVQVERVTFLEQKTLGEWELSTTLWFQEVAARGSEYRLRVPAELADRYRVRVSGAEHRTERLGDGEVAIILRPSVPAATPFSVTVSATVDVPAVSWALPTVSPIDTPTNTDYLLISPPHVLKPEAAITERIQTTALPDWIAQIRSSKTLTKFQDVFAGTRPEWTISRTASTVSAGEVRIPLVNNACWLGDDGRLYGRTGIIVLAAIGKSFEVNWPEGTELRALYVDGTEVVPRFSEKNQLSFFLDSAPAAQSITLHWKHDQPQALTFLGKWTQHVPHPQDDDVERSLLTVVLPEGMQYFNRHGFARISRLEHRIGQIEGLLDAIRRDSSGDIRNSEVLLSLWRLNPSTVEHPSHARADSDAETEDADLHERLIKVEQDVGTLRSSMQAETEISPRSGQARVENVPGVFSPDSEANGALFYGQLPLGGKSKSFSMWQLDAGLLTALLTAFGFIAVFLALVIAYHPSMFKWLDAHPPIACGLVGLLWWFGLEFGLFGLLLFLASAVTVWRQRRRPLRVSENGLVLH